MTCAGVQTKVLERELFQHLRYNKFSSIVLIPQKENKRIKNAPEELGVTVPPNIHVVYYRQENTWGRWKGNFSHLWLWVEIWRVSYFYFYNLCECVWYQTTLTGCCQYDVCSLFGVWVYSSYASNCRRIVNSLVWVQWYWQWDKWNYCWEKKKFRKKEKIKYVFLKRTETPEVPVKIINEQQ